MEITKGKTPTITRNIAVIGFEGAEIPDIVGPLQVWGKKTKVMK